MTLAAKKNQTLMDRWADYEGGVVRSEPTQEQGEETVKEEAPSTKSRSPTKQVWKEKVKSTSNSPV